jgi:hypothetical protein
MSLTQSPGSVLQEQTMTTQNATERVGATITSANLAPAVTSAVIVNISRSSVRKLEVPLIEVLGLIYIILLG